MADLNLANVLTNPSIAKHAFDLDVLEQVSASKHVRDQGDDEDREVDEPDDSWYTNFDINTIDELNSAKLQANTKGNFGTIKVDDGEGQKNVLVSANLYNDEDLFDEDVIYPKGSYEQDDSEQININELKDEFLKHGDIGVDEIEVDTDREFTDTDVTDTDETDEEPELEEEQKKKPVIEVDDDLKDERIEFSDGEDNYSNNDRKDYREEDETGEDTEDEYYNERPIDDDFASGYGVKKSSATKKKKPKDTKTRSEKIAATKLRNAEIDAQIKKLDAAKLEREKRARRERKAQLKKIAALEKENEKIYGRKGRPIKFPRVSAKAGKTVMVDDRPSYVTSNGAGKTNVFGRRQQALIDVRDDLLININDKSGSESSSSDDDLEQEYDIYRDNDLETRHKVYEDLGRRLDEYRKLAGDYIESEDRAIKLQDLVNNTSSSLVKKHIQFSSEDEETDGDNGALRKKRSAIIQGLPPRDAPIDDGYFNDKLKRLNINDSVKQVDILNTYERNEYYEDEKLSEEPSIDDADY